jgi:oligopeptide/dipeptide ABC transporter ATP-binding protein
MEPLLQIENLSTFFQTPEGTVRAVNGVSYQVYKGEILGIVGESGCGKSVSVLSVLRLIPEPPGRIADGKIWFEGLDLLGLSETDLRRIRGNQISMIFQEPMTSLNPVYTIGNQISETFIEHQGLKTREALERSIEMLKLVGISEPEKRVCDYPHRLSGGMRQRVMIAMALSCHPKLLIADEPTTALDVTIQAQILDMMLRLKEEIGTAIILITHNLGLVAETAERIVVMYAGQIVEVGSVVDIFKNPLHPYSQGLLMSVPCIGTKARLGKRRLREIPGVVPSLLHLPKGCAFFPRCNVAKPICQDQQPQLISVEEEHKACCWLYH